ncbi:hypothetical protein KSF73_02770 [Burkholderiaceae bacterium DAT-1]|nr:hypothetical protein [Burkholderiaceae bacterium DAT-1]
MKRQQYGFALFVTLMALVIMSLAAIAVMRTTDATNATTTNITFRQTALASAETGVQAALTWMANNSASLGTNGANAAAPTTTDGYYAVFTNATNSMTGLDVRRVMSTASTDDVNDVNWFGYTAKSNARNPSYPMSTPDALGNSYQYVIQRMCTSTGAVNAAGQTCLIANSTSKVGSSYKATNGGGTPLSGSTQVFYRITVRVVGPRQTETFVEAIVAN